MNKCVGSDGKLKCDTCVRYHSYYGCLAYLTGSGYVQIKQRRDTNFVQNDNKKSIDK